MLVSHGQKIRVGHLVSSWCSSSSSCLCQPTRRGRMPCDEDDAIARPINLESFSSATTHANCRVTGDTYTRRTPPAKSMRCARQQHQTRSECTENRGWLLSNKPSRARLPIVCSQLSTSTVNPMRFLPKPRPTSTYWGGRIDITAISLGHDYGVVISASLRSTV